MVNMFISFNKYMNVMDRRTLRDSTARAYA